VLNLVDDDEIVIKSNKFELLVTGAIITTVAAVLLLAACLCLITLHKTTVNYEIEQLNCIQPLPPSIVRTRAGIEDVPLDNSQVESFCIIYMLCLLGQMPQCLLTGA